MTLTGTEVDLTSVGMSSSIGNNYCDALFQRTIIPFRTQNQQLLVFQGGLPLEEEIDYDECNIVDHEEWAYAVCVNSLVVPGGGQGYVADFIGQLKPPRMVNRHAGVTLRVNNVLFYFEDDPADTLMRINSALAYLTVGIAEATETVFPQLQKCPTIGYSQR